MLIQSDPMAVTDLSNRIAFLCHQTAFLLMAADGIAVCSVFRAYRRPDVLVVV